MMKFLNEAYKFLIRWRFKVREPHVAFAITLCASGVGLIALPPLRDFIFEFLIKSVSPEFKFSDLPIWVPITFAFLLISLGVIIFFYYENRNKRAHPNEGKLNFIIPDGTPFAWMANNIANDKGKITEFRNFDESHQGARLKFTRLEVDSFEEGILALRDCAEYEGFPTYTVTVIGHKCLITADLPNTTPII